MVGGLQPPPAEDEAAAAADASHSAIFVLEGACLETAKVGKVRRRRRRWRRRTGEWGGDPRHGAGVERPACMAAG